MTHSFNLLEKQIRAKIVKEYMALAGYKKAVCFSCGNSSKALRDVGVDVVDVGALGTLTPNTWFSQDQIANTFEGYFNATSGDLPLHLMYKIADGLREALGPDWKGGNVLTGSGETYVCLRLAYPQLKGDILPIRDNTPGTEYSPDANLNRLMELLEAE